jgi:hypothetical protein
MREALSPKAVKSKPLLRRLINSTALILLGFVLGVIPMWVNSRECSSVLSESAHQLNLARIQNTLAAACIDARRADYEPARQAASSFFTSLGTETDKGSGSALSQAQKGGLKPIFIRRDEIITLLARNDPVAGDRLSDLYVSYRSVMNK